MTSIGRSFVVATIASGSLLAARSARADEFTKTVDNAYPITLPELSRERASVMLDTTFATLSANADPNRRGSIWIERIRLETPFYKTSWYVGADYAFFSGLAAGDGKGGSNFLSGNTRLHVRGVWSTFDGLAFGGTFAATLPTANFRSEAGMAVATNATALAPHAINLLRPIDVGLSAHVDARLTLGAVTFQARHGFEYGANPTVVANSQIAVVTTLYVGALFGQNVSFGAEGEQLYLLDEGVPDAQRLSVVARMGATWDLTRVLLGGYLFSTIGTPLAREADAAYGAMIRIGWTWDVRPLRQFINDVSGTREQL